MKNSFVRNVLRNTTLIMLYWLKKWKNMEPVFSMCTGSVFLAYPQMCENCEYKTMPTLEKGKYCEACEKRKEFNKRMERRIRY